MGAQGDPLRRQQYRALAERLVPYVHGGTYAGLLDGPTTVRPDALLEVFNFKGLADRLVPLAMLPLDRVHLGGDRRPDPADARRAG